MRGESKRQQRFAGVIQQDLAELFQREGAGWTGGHFTTITKVRMTPDLSVARIYVSFLDNKKASEGLENIHSKVSEIRYRLGNRIKDHARIVPQLEFFVDDTNEYVEQMDQLFNKIKKDPESQDGDN